MDSVSAVRPSPSLLQAFAPALRTAESPLLAPYSHAESAVAAAFDAIASQDPVKEQQAITHLMSHIDAECFISLLKVMDPPPDDVRDKAEYRRRYSLLRQALELPTPSPIPLPTTAPHDPLW
jgi:hypothetical protein